MKKLILLFLVISINSVYSQGQNNDSSEETNMEVLVNDMCRMLQTAAMHGAERTGNTIESRFIAHLKISKKKPKK